MAWHGIVGMALLAKQKRYRIAFVSFALFSTVQYSNAEEKTWCGAYPSHITYYIYVVGSVYVKWEQTEYIWMDMIVETMVDDGMHVPPIVRSSRKNVDHAAS
jgi:hypothetical protein